MDFKKFLCIIMLLFVQVNLWPARAGLPLYDELQTHYLAASILAKKNLGQLDEDTQYSYRLQAEDLACYHISHAGLPEIECLAAINKLALDMYRRWTWDAAKPDARIEAIKQARDEIDVELTVKRQAQEMNDESPLAEYRKRKKKHLDAIPIFKQINIFSLEKPQEQISPSDSALIDDYFLRQYNFTVE